MLDEDMIEVEDGDELKLISKSRRAANGPAQVQSLCI
jgi:hypothetical protein